MPMRLHDLLDHQARTRPDAEFATDGTTTLTFAEARAIADRLASRIVASGCRNGARVAVLARNTAWYPVLYFAAAKAGVVLLPLNRRLTRREWAAILADAEPSLFLATREHLADADALRDEAPGIARFVGESAAGATGWEDLDDWMTMGAATAPDVRVQPGDPLYQMYTSGTTGMPKGAVLSHAAVCANIFQLSLGVEARPGDRGLVVVPLFHAAVLPAALSVICCGGSVVVHDGFDPERTVRAIDEEGIAVVTFVPAMIQACLVAVGDIADREYAALRSIHYGASPVAEDTVLRAAEAFGCDLVQSYGLTETAQAVTFLSPADHRTAFGARPDLLLSAGRAAAGTHVRLADESGASAAAGDRGEICVHGPQLMSGYWRRPDATAAALRDGWLHTGDVGRLDDEGYLFVEDRVKDMIVSGGENVYPRAVESALFEHPAVADAAVIGVPDPRWGEAVKAVVALRAGTEATADDLIAFCRPRLADFARPKSVDFVDALPRTASGKVLKRVLREPYWAGHARRVSGA